MDDLAGTVERFGVLLVQLLVLFVVISFVLALVQRRIGEDRLARVLSSRSQIVGLLKGALLGAVTPFCSCSTIPMVVGLIQAKVRFATVAAFLLASPLLNPIVVAAIAVMFGVRTAVTYAAVAFVFTMTAAAVWERTGLARDVKRVRLVRPVRQSASVGAATGVDGVSAGAPNAPNGVDADDADVEVPWRGLRAETPDAWRSSAQLLKGMLLPLLIGVSIGAVIYGTVPEDALVRLAGPENPAAIFVAAVAGIPLYIRAIAALPIGSALLEAGVGIGPIFALVIGGAGASIPEVSLLSGIFRPRLVVVFVVTILTVAVTGGFVIALLA